MQINLMPDLSLFAVMAIFLLNYLVVRKFFIAPINKVMVERDEETRSADQAYEEAMMRMQEATDRIELRLHEAKKEAAGVREEFRAEAGARRAQMIEKSSSEGRGIIDEADAKLAEDVVKARETIVRDSESLARMAAQQILGRAV